MLSVVEILRISLGIGLTFTENIGPGLCFVLCAVLDWQQHLTLRNHYRDIGSKLKTNLLKL